MNWTQIPESLAGLDIDALRTLADALKGELKANTVAAETPEDLAEVREMRAKRNEILDRMAALAEAEADEDAPAPVEKPAVEEAKEAAEKPVEPEAPKIEEKELSTKLELESQSEVVAPAKVTDAQTGWVATDNAPGKKAGETFTSFTELAQVLQDRAQTVTSGSDTKHVVAKAFARFDEMQILGDDMLLNLDRMNDEIMAAMCAPLQPLYDLSCENSVARPVRNSLPTFRTPTRGGFSVYPSPSLTDIDTGYGQWTADDDANPNAVKEACQTIECATPVEYRIYGVYRCLTVKNLLQMTFPELVEAYLNRLAAAQARLAETLLLEAMGNGAVSIDAVTLGYGASTTITSTILNYLALYREIERWDDGPVEAWLPRWVIPAMQMDQVRRKRTDGNFKMVPSADQIAGQFRDVGVNPHFYMDRPSWATPIPPLATSSVLNFLPRNLEILLAPRGKFALMDRGELNIGVAPGNLYRDNTSNSRNEFTLFFESFEGVINTNTCPAHIVQINNLCYNGAQIADFVMGCEGIDEPGIGS